MCFMEPFLCLPKSGGLGGGLPPCGNVGEGVSQPMDSQVTAGRWPKEPKKKK